MPGFTVLIPPGPPLRIGGAPLSARTTLYNQDTVASVWVSNKATVSPGNGMLIGPLGTLTWNTDGQCWACVDTGVLAPVMVTASDDVNNVQNPQAVALATATQLLLSGVPNVLKQSTLLSSRIMLPNDVVSIDVSKFASLVIYATTGTGSLNLDLLQLDSAGTVPVDQLQLTNGGYNQDITALRWNVSGGQLFITNKHPQDNANLWVLGSNRAYTNRVSMRHNDINGYHNTVAFGAAGTFNFPLLSPDVHLDGSCYCRFILSGGAATRGQLYALNTSGALILADANEMTSVGTNGLVSKTICLPVGYYQLQAVVNIFVAAGTATLDIIPAAY